MATAKSSPGAASAIAKTPPGATLATGKTPPADAALGALGAILPDGQLQHPATEIPKPDVKTMPVTEYLGMVDKLLQQGLELMVVQRPENPIEFMSIFLNENDTQKKPPIFHQAGPPPSKSSCHCRPGPPLPRTSCGCFTESGWEPNPEFPPVGWPTKTSIEFIQAIDTIALP
ncbi:unnamed protein product [Calypogeia fissa]